MKTQRLAQPTMAGRACLGLSMPLYFLGLSMNWFGSSGVGFGNVVDDHIAAKVAGYLGYGAAVAALLVLLGNLGGSRRALTAILVPTGFWAGAVSLLAGIGVSVDGSQMRPGFPVFISSALLLLVGLVDHWPRRPAR